MIDASLNMVWASDVELVINRLATRKHTLAGLDYFHRTVSNIEDMRTPDGKNPLTLDALEAWEARCRYGCHCRCEQGDHENDGPADHHDRAEDIEGGSLQDPRKVINPRGLGALHGQPQ